MKMLGIILAVLMLLLSGVVGILGTNKSFDLADKIEKLEKVMKALGGDMKSDEIPSAGRLKFGGIVGALGALAAVAGIVLLFIKREKAPMVAGAAAGLALLSILIYPYVETGPTDGMAPRTQAIVAFVMAAIGAGGAFLAHKKSA